MSDKAFLLLLIVFLLAGFVAFDRYTVANGGVSPVSRLVDFAGLSRRDDMSGVRKTRQTIQYESSQTLALLQEKHRQIYEQRNALIQDRRDILRQMRDVNHRLQEEADIFQKVLDDESASFLERFPEVREIGEGLDAALQAGDPQEQARMFQDVEAKIWALFEKVSDDPQSTLPAVKALVEESLAIAQDQTVPEDGDCGTPEECLEKKVLALQKEFAALLEKKTQLAGRAFGQLDSLGLSMDRELDLFEQNIGVTEQRLDENSALMESKLKDIAERLVSVTEADLKELMVQYGEMAKEQKILLENLDINQVRVRDINAKMFASAADISGVMKGLPCSASGRFFASLDEVRGKSQELLASLEERSKAIEQSIAEYWKDHRELAVTMASDLGMDKITRRANRPDVKTRDQIKATERGGPSVPQVRREGVEYINSPVSRPRDLRTQDKVQEQRLHQNAGEQYQRLRTQSQDQGF